MFELKAALAMYNNQKEGKIPFALKVHGHLNIPNENYYVLLKSKDFDFKSIMTFKNFIDVAVNSKILFGEITGPFIWEENCPGIRKISDDELKKVK